MQAFDHGNDLWPFLVEESLPLCFEQLLLRAIFNEHAPASFLLYKTFINKLLVTLQHRQRIKPILRRNVANRRQGVTVGQDAFK